jgi:hypothetical protein
VRTRGTLNPSIHTSKPLHSQLLTLTPLTLTPQLLTPIANCQDLVRTRGTLNPSIHTPKPLYSPLNLDISNPLTL